MFDRDRLFAERHVPACIVEFGTAVILAEVLFNARVTELLPIESIYLNVSFYYVNEK